MSPNQDNFHAQLLKARAADAARVYTQLGYNPPPNACGGQTTYGNTGHTKNNVAGFYSSSISSDTKYSSFGYSRTTENGTYRSLSG